VRGRRRLLVGLTGGLAAGKSTTAALLAEAGCTVFDADRLVAELYRPRAAGTEAVRAAFGQEVLAEDGGIDRQALAARVFGDPEARRRLEALVHPLVRERFRELSRTLDGIVVLEAALLAEAGWRAAFDVLVTVEAPAPLRLERAVARGMQREEAERRMTAQADEALRRGEADFVLENAGGSAELRRQVQRLVAQLERRLEES
jgi:dephospho-CoA kinase